MRAFILFLTAILAFAQDDETPLFRTGVSLVKVDVEVQDTRGSGLAGLLPGDFIVYDEGQRQTIADFAAESEPLRVLMVLDVSPSMSKWLGELGAKSTEALRALRPQDEVGLMTFATRSQLVQPLTTEKKNIGKQVIDNIYKQMLGRETLVNEALVEAAKYMQSQPANSRRAILIVTDNEGMRRAVSNDDVVRALHAADTVLSAILVGDNAPMVSSPYARARYEAPMASAPDVQRYAKETGGEVVTGAAPAVALQPMLKGLTARYSFQYTAPPADEGSFRKIRVELTPDATERNPGVRIKARSGYTVGAAK